MVNRSEISQRLQASLPEGVKKIALPATYLVSIWFALALVGFGLSIRQGPLSKDASQHADFSRGEVRQGRVVTISYPSWMDSTARFKIKDVEIEFSLPAEFFKMTGLPHALNFYVQQGTEVSLKSTMDGTILELSSNPGTPYVKNIVMWGQSTQAYENFQRGRAGRGLLLIILGTLLGVFPFLLHLALSRRKKVIVPWI